MRIMRRGDDGAAMVEFAVILPVFIGLVAAILGFGMAIHTKLELSTGAQEGARAAYLNRPLADVESAVIAAAAVTPQLTSSQVTEATCTPASSGTNVTVRATRAVNFNWILGSTAVTLTGQGVVKCP